MSVPLELGLDTFGDRSTLSSGAPGELASRAQTLRDVVEQAVLADPVGLAFFGVGEQHRSDFAISAPEGPLAAIAARQLRSSIRLIGTEVAPRVREQLGG